MVNRYAAVIKPLGRSLSGMIMPNIGVFIAWGLMTALFIPSGWCPNASLAKLTGPIVMYLLPILIAFTAGKNVAGERGAVIATISVMGAIAVAPIPMFLAAMLIGPFAAWLIKKFDQWVKGKVKPGFEMLVNNFSIGIFGAALAIMAYYGVGPLLVLLSHLLSLGVSFMMHKGILPLVALFIEPGKVLFLNNAINHGILSPIGIEQARESGSSILFLLEANPGPGMGILMAYWAFGKGGAKTTAPGAAIIHFLGGIHEIYFPYLLMRPVLILATILGSMTSISYFLIFGGGLIAPASPGSILSVLAMTPKNALLHNLIAIGLAGIVTFAVASLLLRRAPAESKVQVDLEDTGSAETSSELLAPGSLPRKIIFACDAGMGSSAMAASRFRRKLPEHLSIEVTHASVDQLPKDADWVICQRVFEERARKSAPGASIHLIDNFMQDPVIDACLERILSYRESAKEVIGLDNILIGLPSESPEDAIRRAGDLLCHLEYTQASYTEAMLLREQESSTYIGMGIAIPHGTSEGKKYILSCGIVVLHYPQGVRFNEGIVHLLFGIAGKDDEHIQVLSTICSACEDEPQMEALLAGATKERIMALFESK